MHRSAGDASPASGVSSTIRGHPILIPRRMRYPPPDQKSLEESYWVALIEQRRRKYALRGLHKVDIGCSLSTADRRVSTVDVTSLSRRSIHGKEAGETGFAAGHPGHVDSENSQTRPAARACDRQAHSTDFR